MKKILLMTLVLMALFSTYVHAGSDLQISASSDFSNPKTEFSSSETIYVKVIANSEGKTKKELNLRDNQYNLISTHNLNYLGNNTFQGSLNAPANSGNYSIETRIESDGSVSTSVKTIKIGSPQNASVKVNIQNKVQDQSITDQFNTNNQKSPSPQINSSPLLSNFSPEPEIFDNPDFTFEKDSSPQGSNFLLNLEQFIRKLWASLWPFRQ